MKKCSEIKKDLREPSTCAELLKKFSESKKVLLTGEILRFSGVNGCDVYNISPVMSNDGKLIVAGRVEARDAHDSQIIFFQEKKGIWDPINGTPSFQLEDGFSTKIGNEIIFGGVEVYKNPLINDSQNIGYRTVFYRGNDLSSLQKFAVGPDGMKDIRIASLNGQIGVFTRPQGEGHGKGRIGYLEVNSLKDINPENLLRAKIIENQFISDQWGGANYLSPMKNGNISVYGHIAYEDEQDIKHYYATKFVYNPKTHHASPIEIILTRDNFPKGEAKTPKHEDIIFLGGTANCNRKTTTFCGLSDAGAGSI